MRRLLTAALGIAALGLVAAPPAPAAGPAPYDGSNPFVCTLQNVGLGTDFPRPGDDPFCVEYDKTHQNVTRLGVVEFLAQEPARVAAATPKCFYYQRDHWTGSIVQGDGRTETYNFDGSYYFDKARGAGGVHVRNFRVAGSAGDPTVVPGFPAEYRPFFGPGRGGVQQTGAGVDVEPRCVELARRKRVYRSPGSRRACRVPGGRVGRGIGGIRLGARRASVRSALGPPTSESRRAVRYCLEGGGTLSAGFRGRSGRSRALIVKVDHPAFDTRRGLRPGIGSRRARRILRGERVYRSGRRTRLLVLRQRRRTLVAAVRRGRVAWVAVARPRIPVRTLRRDIRRVR